MSAESRDKAPAPDPPVAERAAGGDERFRRAFQYSNDAIFIFDPSGDAILDANERAERMLGYSRDELLETPISDIHPNEMEELKRFAETVMSEGHGWTNLLNCVTRAGNALPAEISAAAITIDGRPHLLASVRDVSERKKAEDALRASESRYRTMYDHTPVMMQSIDEEGLLVSVNQFWLDTLGYDRDEVIGRPILEFVAEPYRKLSRDVSIPKLWRDGHVADIERKFVKKNGALVDVLLSAIAAEDPVSGERYSLAFLFDVTERNRMEAALRESEKEKVYLKEELDVARGFGEIVGESEGMRKVFRAIETVAPTDASVLILGETGTGKELVARAVHRASPQSKKSLVSVNCSALPATLVESELFGHEKGAFTGALARRLGRFELADQGTIFLDEIGDLPLELQAKLLRVLQGGDFERLGGADTIRVNVRVIAATNRDLEKAQEEGRFRSDLFYRLNVFPIELPPLRERRGDIPLLARHFAQKHAVRLGKQVDEISPETMSALLAYPWPGNVRELENVIERGIIIAGGGRLEPGAWLPGHSEAGPPAAALPTLDEIQRRHILQTLERTGWKVSGAGGAAEILGLKPTTLEARMKKLGIERE